MIIGAVPPAKRHGAGTGHHFVIICKRYLPLDRAPDSLHLLAIVLSYALVTGRSSAVGPGPMLIAWDEIATIPDI